MGIIGFQFLKVSYERTREKRRHPNKNLQISDILISFICFNFWLKIRRTFYFFFRSNSWQFSSIQPEFTDDFKHFLITMYGSNWEKRVLSYQTMTVEQLYAPITGYNKLISRIKRAWLPQFDSWSSNQLRVQIKGLAESGGFLEIE